MHRILALLLIFFFPNIIFGQGGYFQASGRIVDKESHLPLSEAYICIPSTGFGTAPNLDGDFIFQFPNINIDSGVVVAMVGYTSQRFLANTLKVDSNIIYLEKCRYMMPIMVCQM
jgi:hypothetical protein